MFLRLILPIIAMCVISFIAHIYLNWDGFFLNLGTELIGILVTVAYVDWIVRNKEKQKWRGVEKRTSLQLQTLTNYTISGLRRVFGFTPDAIPLSVSGGDSAKEIKEAIKIFAKNTLAPVISEKVVHLNSNDWSTLVSHLKTVIVRFDDFMDRYNSYLQPRTIELILDLQEKCHSVLWFPETFPEFLSSEFDFSHSQQQLTDEALDGIGASIELLIEDACDLLDTLDIENV